MNTQQLLLLLYVLAPLAGALAPWPKRLWSGLLGSGALISIARTIILVTLAGAVVSRGETILLGGTLVNGYPLEMILVLNKFKFGFLITAELCFLLAHWMIPASPSNSPLVRMLVCVLQGFCSLFILSENAVSTGGIQLLSGVGFFYLVRFSLAGSREILGALISRRLYTLFFLLGLIMVGWGIAEFGSGDLRFAKGSSSFGVALWMSMLILAVPIAPWSRWFGQSVEFLPEGVSLVAVTFISGMVLKLASFLSIVYPDLQWSQKAVIYWLGVLGCGFSLSGLFAAKTRRRMLGSLPGFFLSLILVSVGVSVKDLVIAAYFACIFVPVCTGLLLYASVMSSTKALHKVFIGLLIAIVFGLPGTPVFLIFSAIGARSLDMGASYMLLFALIWFFYFSANVYVCRRIFLDQSPPEPGVFSPLGQSPESFTAYGIFLMVFLVAATQVAWRVL